MVILVNSARGITDDTEYYLKVYHVTVACLMSLYQECRFSFSDFLLNSGSHFIKAGWDRDLGLRLGFETIL